MSRKNENTTNTTVNFSEPTIISANDYYPFGLQMDQRSYTLGGAKGHRYGFNGKEKDTDGEWGDNTHYDYGFRIYNPAIAKFLSVDPLAQSYPWYTPYQFAGNKPIFAIDLDGLEEDPVPDKQSSEEPKSAFRVNPAPVAATSVVKELAIKVLRGAASAPAMTAGLVLMPTSMGNSDPIDLDQILLDNPEFENFDERPLPYDPTVRPPLSEDGSPQSYLYRTTRSVKSKGWTSLPYYGITTNKVVGGRYPLSAEESLNVEVIAIGSSYEIKGAETRIILLNSDNDPTKVRGSTRIDNLTISTSDPLRIMAGEALLNSEDPGWQENRLEDETPIE